MVEVDDLTVSAGGRVLVREASFRVRPGEVYLIVGPSGAGKSVLLRVLAGLIDRRTHGFEIQGKARIGDEELLSAGSFRRVRGKVGIVFQEFALFDELSARANLAFAYDHARQKPGPRKEALEQLMTDFDIEANLPLRHASPGQRQRVAVARTLAFNPDVLLYDEPTSGLDPANSLRLSERIKKTARTRAKATIVVTHDYTFLAPVADKILWLDPATCALTEYHSLELQEKALAAPPPPVPKPPRRFLSLAPLFHAVAFAAALPEAAIDLLRFVWPLFPKLRWGIRYLKHYFMLVASPSAFLYIGVAGAITGFVATYFTFQYFPYRAYTEPLLIDDVLGSLGFLLYRVLVPVLATILIAARCGSAVAADVGNRSWSGGLEALRSFGIDPRRYLYTSVIWAFLIGVPLMTAAGFLLAELASLSAFMIHHPDRFPLFWDLHFHRFLVLEDASLPYVGSEWLLLKLLACAVSTALITYRSAASPKISVVSVNRGITVTVIWATLAVLLVHLVFAFLEF